MSDTKHTPGPWTWYGDRALEAVDSTVLVGDCGLPSCGKTRLFVEVADAHLIAAAPELLAALKLAYEGVMGRHIEGLPSMIRAAIAKAEGKP